MMKVKLGVIIHSHLSLSVCKFYDFPHHHHRWLNSLSLALPLSHFMMHRSYILPQIIHIATVKITAAIICHFVSFLFLAWVRHHGVWRQNKKNH